MKELKKLLENAGMREANPDGSISTDEDEDRDHLLAMFEMELDELVSNAIQDAEEIGGQFRSPGIMAQLRTILQTKQTEMRRRRYGDSGEDI